MAERRNGITEICVSCFEIFGAHGLSTLEILKLVLNLPHGLLL